jgi:hypothetical protein
MFQKKLNRIYEVISAKINSRSARNNGGQQVDLKCGYISKTLLDISFQKVLIVYAEKSVILSIQICYIKFCGPGSSDGIANDYGLDGPGIESRWGRYFPHLSRPGLEPTQLPVQ